MQSSSNAQVSGNIQIQVAIAPGCGSIVVEKADGQVRTAINIEPIRSELYAAMYIQQEFSLRAEKQGPARRATGQIEKVACGKETQLQAGNRAQRHEA